MWILIWCVLTATSVTSGQAEFSDKAACIAAYNNIVQNMRDDKLGGWVSCNPKAAPKDAVPE